MTEWIKSPHPNNKPKCKVCDIKNTHPVWKKGGSKYHPIAKACRICGYIIKEEVIE